MTLEQQAEPTAARRTKPPVRRRPPAPAPRPETNGGEVQDVATMAEQLAAMRAEIAALQAGQARVLEAEVPLPPHARVADPETLTPFLRRLLDQTSPVPKDFAPPTVSYNHRPRWFAIPDGRVVQLQGSPQSVELYTSKGYKLLNAEEEREWLKTERPRLIKHQRRVAYLLNGIHKAIAVEPKLQAGLDADFEAKIERMTVSELEGVWGKIAGSGDGARLVLTMPDRLQDEDDRAAEAETQRLLAGVEKTPSRTAREAFEGSLPNIPRRSRDVEVTQQNYRQFT
jgi:hypothetical protein